MATTDTTLRILCSLWQDGKQINALEHPDVVVAICAHDGFFPVKGNRWMTHKRQPAVFTSCEDGRVRMWHADPVENSDGWNSRWSREFGGQVFGVARALLAVDIPGEYATIPSLFAGSDDKFIRQYHLKGGACVRTFSGHAAPLSSMCIAQGSKGTLARLLSGSQDNILKVWDIQAQPPKLLRGHIAQNVAMCHAAGWVFSAAKGSNTRMWDISSGSCMAEISTVSAATTLCSDGTVLFVGMEDGTVERFAINELTAGPTRLITMTLCSTSF